MPLVLLSGGMDSCAALAHTLIKPSHWSPVETVAVDYGQKHRTELDSAQRIAAHYKLTHHVLDLRGALAAAASSLTRDGLDVPEGHYSDETMSATVVPGRNLVFLAAAASLAQARNLGALVIGVHAGDHPVYADCRPDFIATAASAIALSSAMEVRVEAPFVHKTKADIAEFGYSKLAPFHLTWSCYKGGDIHCGKCGTCVERAEAFHLAGVTDPTVYEDAAFWLTATQGAGA